MQSKRGFTLIELMVVIAIVGLLAMMAVPTYRIYQQRSYGAHAQAMMKQILDAQVTYYLDHNKFFPEDDNAIMILHNDPAGSPDLQKIKKALQVDIPRGVFLDYYFYAANNDPTVPNCFLIIQASRSFPLFRGGAPRGSVVGSVNNQGKMEIFAY
jgi:type II secretion system protein G